MQWVAVLVLGLALLLAGGCATTAPEPKPAPARPRVRDATPEEREAVGRLLVPLLITSGMWTGPADGCAASLGILTSDAINLATGPNERCKFSLGITEEALRVLPPDELRAGLAHELGHVQLGHFAARKDRRVAEKKTRDELNEKNSKAAAVGAIPIIGPILAIGVAGTQMLTDPDVEGQYRAYDREEELAADRYGQDLLELVIGRVRACQAEVALLERLVQARASRPWAAWLSTHPKPADRLKDAKEHCPG
ncbi:MAG TPA: M48 family metalloprotease [Terriglobales bacterium]|nr:M48 family metalloprotease [Terriglobales bacterium]